MVNPNFIDLALFDYDSNFCPPDSVLAQLARYMSKNNLEVVKMHNDNTHYTLYTRNHVLTTKIVLQNKGGEWVFKVVSIRPKQPRVKHIATVAAAEVVA